MDDSSIDEMVTGIPSIERRAMGLVWAYVIGCFIYAGVLILGLVFLFLLA